MNLTLAEVIAKQERAEKTARELEHKSRDLGFTWGSLSVLVPVVVVLLVFAALDVTLDEELLKEHKWVSAAILVPFVGWGKLMRWAGVTRHDPKRNYDDDE